MSRVAWVVLVGVLVACGPNAAEDATTATALPRTATTMTTVVGESTTTTVAEAHVDICQGQTVIWESGETFTASCFALPWSVVSPGDGWRAPGIDDDSMLVSWIDPSDLNNRVNLVLLLGGESPQGRLESILSIEGLDQIDSGSSVVAGFDAPWVDVEGRPVNSSFNEGCMADGSGGILIAGGMPNGYQISPTPGDFSGGALGVGGCDIARIWVIEVQSLTVTIIGGTADPDRHSAAVAKIEELFEGMSFDVGVGS